MPQTDDHGLEFAQLLVRHDRTLLRYIMTLIPRRDDAEEVLQRTATVLWEKFAEYDRNRAFLPWAFRVAYFEVLNFRKEMARSRLIFREDVLELLAETRDQVGPDLDRRRDALHQCLERLPQDDLKLLQRRYCDSESIAALAEELDRTAKALYRRLDRVRELLVTCVERRVATAGLQTGSQP
jgi:RNA polymerase sigma-70 factor, ECF subfamily